MPMNEIRENLKEDANKHSEKIKTIEVYIEKINMNFQNYLSQFLNKFH